MDRRTFGRRVFELSAALGLRSVGASSLSALGGSLAACRDSLDDLREPGSKRLESADARELTASSAVANSKVMIIGSGYGSAVAALRLTEQGIPVTMLEMGRLWNERRADGRVFCSPLQPDGRAMWFQDHTEVVVKQISILGIPIGTQMATPVEAGIIAVSGPDHMRVHRGRGVGGGSLVNTANFLLPERDVLRRALPDVDSDAMYNTYYPLAKRNLRSKLAPASLVNGDYYQYSRVGVAAAQLAGYTSERLESGYDFDYMAREIAGTVPKSATAGEAVFGNNYGKWSLDKTYLAEAMGTGLLTILPLHEVKRITPAPGGGYLLDVQEIEIDGEVIARKQMECSHLFVGAGSMGTSELLLRSRERGDLPDLSMAVGTAWGPNNDTFVARDNPFWVPTGVNQAAIPSSGFRTLDAHGKHVFSMIDPLPIGIETNISLNVLMIENSEAGHFAYDSSSDTVTLKWDPVQSEAAEKSARYVFDTINVKNRSSYHEGMFGGQTVCTNTSYHPVGGCTLGRATDSFGRIPQYPGLYVVDGSLISVGLAVNPALTITALAERNIERVLHEDFGV